ncbi:MAG: ABC transporter ATP-binding protein [Patescibacteria group bacterium]
MKLSVWQHYRKAIGSKLALSFAGYSFLYLIGVVAGGVIAPIYYKGIIDALASKDVALIYKFFWLLLGANLVQLVLNRLHENRRVYELGDSLSKVASYALSNLTNHSYQFFIDNFSGSLVNKVRKFTGAYDQMTEIIVADFLYAAVSIAGIVIVLCKTSFILASAAIAWFVLYTSILFYCTRQRLPLERKRGEIESTVTGVLSDIVSNVLNLKLFSSKGREEKYFGKWLDKESVLRLKAWIYATNMYSALAVVALLAQSSLIFLSILLWSYGDVTAGTIVLVISYSGTLFQRLSGISSAIRRFFEAYTNASEFAEILNKDLEIMDSKDTEDLKIKDGEVYFDKVSFYYKQSSKIFDKFNLKIKAGEKIGIVGTSGAGKTTITKLLLRFADVTSGAIKIDGQDIRNLKQDDLRSVISYVPQDPILFHRSLSENIAYGKPDAKKSEIIEAAKQAHAHEFISGLHQGYDTLVGERGVKLSGGERQRVAIARAILKDAPILILDEATSSLDSVSETHIKAALDVLMKGRTTIVIAHRLSTIEKMDRIIVLEQGKIAEEGTHKDLIAQKGVYHNFWSHQQRGFIK